MCDRPLRAWWLVGAEMDKAIDTTAKALATLSHHVGSGKDQAPSKGFQTLIRQIGEAKTKHVSLL